MESIWTVLYCHYVQNFPLVPEMLSKIQSDPSLLGYSVFSNGCRKYAIWDYVAKYLNIALLFRISPRFQKRYQNPTLGLWAGAFFHNWLTTYWKYFPRMFPFLHRKTYLLKYWTRRPSVCQSFSLSARQSVSPSVIGIWNPFLNRPQVLGLFV